MPSTSSPINQAIVLAAGFGTRLRPITDTVPKAMVRVHGKPLLDYALDHAIQAGVKRAIVNTHYLPNIISEHLTSRTHPQITLSHEPEILETGGGIKNVIEFFGDDPFFAINADSLWRDENPENGLLTQLKTKWDGDKMDALLAVIPREPADYVGAQNLDGDFTMTADGKLHRNGETKPMQWVYIGVQILHPRIFNRFANGKFSLNEPYKSAEQKGRLYGFQALQIDWFHISTPQDLAETERIFCSMAK